MPILGGMLEGKRYGHVNLIFWTGYFLYEWLANAALDDAYYHDFVQACLYTSITFITAWVTLHVVIQRYFLPERKRGAWLVLAASIVGFILARRAISFYIIYRNYHPEYVEHPYWSIKIVLEGTWLYLIVGSNIMLYFMRAWYEQQRIAETLKRDKAIAQLELLKSQVHPHFIFNTLNNIYSLSLQQDPRIPDLIHRLSSLLSYMLYDSKDKVIPVTREVEYILNYVELQKIRYSDRLDMSVNIFGKLDAFYVAPLLLLPLMENCFKHGVSNEVDRCWIRLDLSREEDWLVVKLENSRGQNGSAGRSPAESGGDGRPLAENGGIGLANVRRRLEILYPEQHEFKTLSEDQSFLVVLKIKNKSDEDDLSDSR